MRRHLIGWHLHRLDPLRWSWGVERVIGGLLFKWGSRERRQWWEIVFFFIAAAAALSSGRAVCRRRRPKKARCTSQATGAGYSGRSSCRLGRR